LHGVHFEGVAIGLGGDVAFRLYDKTREIRKTNKLHWQDVWLDAGWDGKSKVYRAEFQLKRRELMDYGFHTWVEVLCGAPSMWAHYSDKWLRVCDVDQTDKKSTRWDVVYWWKSMRDYFGTYESRMQRRKVDPQPVSPAYKFRNGLSAIIGHMASTGQKNLGDALNSFLEGAREYHGGWEGFRGYVCRKLEDHSYRQSVVRDRSSVFTPNDMRHYLPHEMFDDGLEAIPF
jgi:hypothetical protein